MKNILISNQPKIKDPIIREFVDRTTEIMLVSINQQLLNKVDARKFKYKGKNFTVGGKKKKKYNSVATVLEKHIESQKLIDLKLFTKQFSRESLYTDRTKFLIGKELDISSKTHIYNSKQIKTLYKHIPLKRITKKYALQFLINIATTEEESTPDPIIVNKGIKFQLKEVYCVDDTSEWGDDEIAMGGTFTDSQATSTKLNEFRVHNDFRTGVSKTYSPKILKSFAMPTGDYPQTYSAFITLAEKDHGGFSNFISELYESVKAEVQVILTALGAAAGASIGSSIGGSVGTAVGGPIGTIIGIAAGAIVGALIGALAAGLRDDVFIPQVASITLPTQGATFSNGSLTSPYYYLNFEGHGGEYRVKYRWKLNQ